MKEEKQMDRLIDEIMKTDGLENPPSSNFTQQIVAQAATYQLTRKNKHQRNNLIALVFIGVFMLLSLSFAIYFLWQSGQLAWLGNTANQLLNPIMQMIPFKIPLGLLGAVALHFVLVRVAIAIILFKKRYKLLNLKIIRN